MDELSKTYKTTGDLHHAYLIEGSLGNTRARLLDFLEKDCGFSCMGNPDFWIGDFDNFTVDDSRHLIDLHDKKLVGEKRFFVICVNAMTMQAQNALLKMFEEPAQNNHFFILAPSREFFLPTLKSRLVVVSDRSSGVDDIAKEFMSSNPAKRIKLIANIVKKDEKSAIALELVDAAIEYSNKALDMQKAKKADARVLQELTKVRSRLLSKTCSLKQLLEYTALIAP